VNCLSNQKRFPPFKIWPTFPTPKACIFATMDPYEFHPWYPKGAKYIIAAGTSNYIAIVDEDTVLKFPIVSPDQDECYTAKGLAYRLDLRRQAIKGLEVEEQILKTLGRHPRIIQLKGKHEAGLLLEYMPYGSVERYLHENAPNVGKAQRLKWALQAAEALAYTHARNVLHCDISVGNLLLDSDRNIRMSDFQGRLLGPNGAVILDGGVTERTTSSMPRENPYDQNHKTDIFALGTAIYFMMTGHPPFPNLDAVDDEDEIQRRFRDGQFPHLEKYCGGDVIQKCWNGGYESAGEIVKDLEKLAS